MHLEHCSASPYERVAASAGAIFVEWWAPVDSPWRPAHLLSPKPDELHIHLLPEEGR